MIKKFRSGMFLALALTAFAVSVLAQSEFKDANAEYSFSLPSDSWKMTVKPSQMSPNVEYVYNFRKDGHLEVRKMTVDVNMTFDEMIRTEEQKLQFVPGFVSGRAENFKGALSGKVFNYEFIRSGRNMSGRFYFLKSDATTVYVLRFTGLKNSLRTLRNETDQIARTFRID